ncbi:MAG: hypothetical protein JXB07_06460 [Anaerolineae bacterium]|nr:hypothetical protein [Anaerolineae bacterium]
MSTINLGQFISKHQLTFGEKWGKLFTGIVLICLSPVAYLGIGMLWNGAGSAMQDVVDSTPILRFLPLIVGGVLFIVGVLNLLVLGRNWPLAVKLYENGMEYTDRRGTRQVVWNDIVGISQTIIRHRFLFITTGIDCITNVQLGGGEMLIFDQRFSEGEKLGQVLQERIASLQLPACMAEIQTGKRIAFGVLSLDREGVYQHDKMLTWDNVGKVAIKNGMLSISKKDGKWGHWTNVYVSEVPNAMLLCLIARQFGVAG